MTRKFIDLILIVLATAGLAYGIFILGGSVIRESHDAAIRSSGDAGGPSTTTTTTTTSSDHKARNRRRAELAGIAVAGVLAFWILLGSIVGAIRRRRLRSRREWRLPR